MSREEAMVASTVDWEEIRAEPASDAGENTASGHGVAEAAEHG